MTIVCDAIGCHNRKTVDLEALAFELGEDYTVAALVARSRFSKCGAKWPQLSVRVGSIHTCPYRKYDPDAILTRRKSDSDI
jgi:hypothetical protein